MNAITDRVPVNYFDREDDKEEEEEAETPTREDLVHRERSLWSRITPNSWRGTVIYLAVAIGLSAIFLWLRPVIPPWFTSLPSLLAMLVPVALLVGAVIGRRSGIRFWQQFTDFKLYTGSAVIEFVGKVDGHAGDDPLIKSVKRVSSLGFGVEYERIDDRFKSDTPLFSKIARKRKDGSWEPARGKLDHVYQAQGPSSVFNDAVVVHCSGIDETPTAKTFEWKTSPPDIVDVDAARELVRRDEMLREVVIPHYEDMEETQEEQVERFRQAARDDEPHIKMTDLPELLLAFGAVTRPGQSGQSRSRAALQALDEDVEETMEERTDE